MAERAVPEHRWDHYRATIVTITVDGEQIEARDLAGRLDATIHIITAWNPGAERPGDAENRRRNEALRAELAAVTDPVLPAVGTSTEEADPDEPHSEESWAVIGVDLNDALAFGARYDQDAIFEITAESQTVVKCPPRPAGDPYGN